LRGFSVVLILAALLPVKAWALTSDEIDIGEQLRGPALTVKDFTGKVVLVDLWGIYCVPCIKRMPDLQQLYKTYHDAGFHIVAFERQSDTRKKVEEFFANHPLFNKKDPKKPELEFQFTYAYRIPIPNRFTSVLPWNYLFSADGILLGTDLKDKELEAKVQEALVESLAGLTNAGDIGTLKEYDVRLKTGRNMLATLSDLARVKRESKDPKVIAEATTLFSAVFEWANKKFSKAMAEKDVNPVHSIMRLKTIARELKGTQIGDKAAKAIKELSGDERVEKHDAAEKALTAIITQISDLKPVNNKADPDDPEFRKQNVEALRTLFQECARLQVRYPGTEAAGHIDYIITEFHLKDLR